MSNSHSRLLASSTLVPRWGDQDAFGHANNAVYLTWLEEARLRWLSSLDGEWFCMDSAPVLARSEINYRRPVVWPQNLRVELYAGRVGNSSLTLHHRILSDSDDTLLFADGSVVLVWINPDLGTPVPLPAGVRKAAAGPDSD